MRQALLLLVLASAAARTAEHAADHVAPSPHDAHIVVTINPEARVSAVRSATLPLPAPCGSAVTLKVKIVNQGFVTARFQASVVGDGAHRVEMHMDEAKLNGQPQDHRLLHLIPVHPGPVDVTIAFSIDDNIGGHGGHDRMHLLVRCLQRR